MRALARWAAGAGLSGHVEDLDHEAIAQFMVAPQTRACADGRAKRATSVNALRTSLRCFFGYLRDVGHLPSNPAHRLRRAHCSPPPVRAIPDEDLDRLVASIAAARGTAAQRDLVLVRLLAESGMRLGSAIALDVSDLDLDRGEAILRSAKCDHRQVVVLPRAICALLQDYLGDRSAGPVFPGTAGKPISARQVQHRFALWLTRAGVRRPATVHSLRHRFAIQLYHKTSDLLLVQQALGHRSIVSTTVYARADRMRLVAAIG